jgi:hypothetical protein
VGRGAQDAEGAGMSGRADLITYRGAKGRPAEAGEDPSDLARASYEALFVREKRAADVSWQNIARMLGVAEADLRARHT